MPKGGLLDKRHAIISALSFLAENSTPDSGIRYSEWHEALPKKLGVTKRQAELILDGAIEIGTSELLPLIQIHQYSGDRVDTFHFCGYDACLDSIVFELPACLSPPRGVN